MKKFISTLLALSTVVTISSNFVACKPPDFEQIDKSKVQLYVLNYNGGFGDKWLKDAKKEFEELHAEDTYGDKKGVQIMIDSNKTLGTDIETKLMNAEAEIYFTQNMSPLYDYISLDYLLDITDIVTTKAAGDETTIEEKMSPSQKEFLKVDFKNTGTPKYYAIPHYSVYMGIVYDIDLFESQGLYLLEDGGYSIPGAFMNGQYIGSGKLAKGPDGESGTYDDGMPATYEEFFDLCNYMLDSKSIMPFHWFGKGGAMYQNDLMLSMYADYEGVDQMSLNFTMDGTATNLISVDDNGNVTPRDDLEINSDNAYELATQAGLWYSMQFLETVNAGKSDKNKLYHNPTKTGSMTYTHLQAQSDYLYSSYRQSPIAMLIDGVWWENEASDTFTAMESLSLGKKDRRFGMLPFPKATNEKVGEKFTVYDGKAAFGFIAKNTPKDKHEIAKEFLQFCYNEDNLAKFSAATNTFRDLKYTLSPEQQENLSGFGKSLYNMHISDNVEIVYPYSSNLKFVNNANTIINFLGSTRISGNKVGITSKLGKESLTTLFNNVKDYREDSWDTLN